VTFFGWVYNSVEKGRMTQENADQFVSNSLQNAKNLENVGILKGDGEGNYSFKDEKSKEILSNNIGGSYEHIGKENLDAYKATSIQSEKSEEVQTDKSAAVESKEKEAEKVEALVSAKADSSEKSKAVEVKLELKR